MAGTYTDIVEIVAPSSAGAGDLVNVEVKVRNLYTAPIYIAVSGRYNGVDIAFSPDWPVVEAGAIQSFTASFTMPNNDILLEAWSFYWTGTEPYQDDYDYVDIPLAVVIYQGTISRKEVEYDGRTAGIPVS